MTITSIAFTVSGTNASFDVVSLKGQEALSNLFLFDLTLVSAETSVNSADVIGKSASITINSQRGGDPALALPYYGILTQFEQHQQVGSGAGALVYYHARVQPQLSRLATIRTSAVYVDPDPDQPTKTVKDVITDVLTRAVSASPGLKYEFKQIEADKLRKRAFRCQFEESDLDYISRLMEAEGLYYYFEHSDADKDKLIITSQRMAHADAPRSTVNMRPSGGLGVDDDLLFSFVGQQKMLPNKVVLRDYNYDKADVGVLKKEASVYSQGVGEVMLYGEDFLTDAEGGVLATLRAQELACRGKQYLAEGSATGLRAGYLVTLASHFNTSLNNKKYLVVDVTHNAAINVQALAGDPDAPKATTYTVTITAIPYTDKFDNLDVQFRPQRSTPKPRIHGTITAKIDDDTTGQYASIDTKGRYKVLMPFVDNSSTQAGKGSAWIRMAAPYSGSYENVAHGIHFPLHKGAEVLLSFLEGDPDHPIIVGAVPNSQNLNVVTQTNQKQSRIHTSGGNYILTNDEKDAEGMMMMSPYEGSYLRVGKAFAGEAGMDPGEDGIAHPEKVGLAMYTNGDGLQYFTGSFISITGVGETKPVFGKLDWQIAHGWDKDVALLPGSDTELNLKNNITHTHADNIERTLGNNISTTIGDTTEDTVGNTTSTTKGNTTETTNGNSNSTTYGDSTEETHGNSTATIRGNSQEDTWGNTLSSHMGASEEFFFGNQLAISLSTSQELKLAASAEIALGLAFEMYAGAKFSCGFGREIKLNDGCTEGKIGPDMKFTPAMDVEAKIGEMKSVVNDVGARVNQISAATNEIQGCSNKLGSYAAKIDTGAITLIM